MAQSESPDVSEQLTAALKEAENRNCKLKKKVNHLEQRNKVLETAVECMREEQNERENERKKEMILQELPSNERYRQESQEIQDLKAQVERLIKETELLKSKNSELEQQLNKDECFHRLPWDDKDKQLQQLRERLSDLEKKNQANRLYCGMLNNERESVKLQLKETVKHCTSLMRQLEMRTTQHNNSNPTETENRLREKIKEVTAINQKWQEYHAQTDEHIQHLQDKIRQLEAELRRCQSQPIGFTERQQQQIDKLLAEYKAQISTAEQAQYQAQTELEQVKSEMKHLQRTILQKDATISMLKTQIGLLSSGDQSLESNVSERIEMLEQQLIIYKEDFENERKDRERIQAELFSLREERRQQQGYRAWNGETDRRDMFDDHQLIGR